MLQNKQEFFKNLSIESKFQIKITHQNFNKTNKNRAKDELKNMGSCRYTNLSEKNKKR